MLDDLRVAAAPAREGAAVPEPPIRSSTVVDLNLIKVRLSSNLETFPPLSYFTRFVTGEAAYHPVDFDLRCFDLGRDPVDTDLLRGRVDASVRASQMAKGYYRGPYFGDPAYLINRGRRLQVYGTSLERLVWPYFVKFMLNAYAADAGYTDLKAGGFTVPGHGATLLFGQTGGGKTTFLTQACLGGAHFLTNTHALLRGRTAHGVPSSIRVRADSYFQGIIAERGLRPHLESGEYIAGPDQLFSAPSVDSAPVRNIVLLSPRTAGARRLRRVPGSVALAFLDQFGLGVTTYGLKDDLLTYLGYDLDAYAEHYRRMKATLADMCETARCYTSAVDMTDPVVRRDILDELSA